MQKMISNFSNRQYMITQDFEFFHYRDRTAVDVGYHNHDFYEIFFFISGKVSYIIEGKTYFIQSGDILLINNKDLHKPVIDYEGTYERIVIWVNPDYLKKNSLDNSDLTMCFENTKKYNLIRPNIEMRAKLQSILNHLESSCNSAGFGNDILKKLYLMELIVYLNKAMLETQKDKLEIDIEYNKKVNSVIEYINEHLTSDLSLDYLSSIFFLCKYHLSREFKKYTGYTLYNYILLKRLIRSKELLGKGLTVTDTCNQCGFGDYSNFIRTFKKHIGTSPKKYARQIIND